MRTSLRKPSLKGPAATSLAIASATVLALLLSVLINGSLVLKPDAAHAQAQHRQTAGHQNAIQVQTQAQDVSLLRLEVFIVNNDGSISHKWSDDDGVSWSSWANLGTPGGTYHFVGTPAMVSDGVGRLNVFARTFIPSSGTGELWYNTYNNGTWSGWHHIPGEAASGLICISRFDCYDYNQFPSDAAVSSWGPGRLDVFVNATRIADNSRVLLHTWADNSTFSGTWEVLGSGLMQGNPAAVSWGPGRVDVFVRGGGNELDHKWFDNGHWSSGWENVGGNTIGSPAVLSWRSGFFALFIWNANHGLLS